MRRRLAVLKHFTPSIVLLSLAVLATLFAHPHITVPIILVIGAIVMAWQNYRILRLRDKSQEQQNDEVQVVD